MPRLHHFQVVVARGQTGAVTDFYALLGLEAIVKPVAEGVQTEGAWFQTPTGGQLHISERDDARADNDRHFGLVIDDYDATTKSLRSLGLRVDERAPVLGTRRCMAYDPLGNAVELIEDRGGFV